VADNSTQPPDGSPTFGLQSVDHDPFAMDPQAEPAALALPPDQPKPETSPEATPSPLKADLKSWDDWGAVGGMVKAGKLLDAPLDAPSLPTREQWQKGEQAFGHGVEHLATMPMRLAQKIATIATPTEPETPGQLTEADVAKDKYRAQTERDLGASTALQMVLGGPGSVEEGAAAHGLRGALKQPDVAAEAARVDQRLPTAKKPIESEGPNRVDTDAMRLTPKSYENNVGLVRNYPGVKIPPRASTDAAKNTGEPTRVAWGSLPEIAKAVNVIDANGDPAALNSMIGFRHKVRSFYNNLISPNSAAGDVTVDTHAVAAGLLRPVTANSVEVAHNFGNWPGKDIPAAKNSAKTGIWGTYPLYADAYRQAAAEAGVLPRQLQSITWEAARGLFPEDWKSAKNSAIIDNVWRQYRAGKETIDGARQRILNTTGGIQPPTWYRPARSNNAPTQSAGLAPDVFEPRVYGPGSQPSFAGTGRGTAGGASAPPVRPSPRDLAYEFDFGAGAPYNEQFPQWASLSGDQKATISKAMLDKIADHAKEVTGANEYARLSGLGGWHEFTNPSYKSRLVATPEVAGDFADTMGYLAQQTKIMGYRPDPAGDRLGLALYGDGLGDEKKLAAFWKDVNDKHPDFSSGFSPSRNQRGQPGIEMLFDQSHPGMDARVTSEFIPALQRIADDHALGKIDSKTFRATEESREHDWTKDPTGGDYTSRLSARHGPDLLKRLELFKRQELEPALQQQIDAAQGASPGRGGDRGAGVQKTQGAPALPFRAAASPVKLGSGITDERTAAVRAAAVAAGGRPNLIGLPTENITLAGKPFVPGPVGAIHDIAEKYMADAGLPYDPPKTWVPADKARATKIAQAFEDMKHAPDDPQVKASYDAMANETVAQFKALKDSGIKFEFIKPGMDDPYAENPRAAAQDVINNNHLWVFPTEGGFGSGSESAEAAMKNNPLLRPSGEKIEGKEVPVNDLFRIVHDVFGHLKDGNGFRASGEENAWRSHSAMYSDAARPAMTSETRGQNSYVNYGPHGEFNRTASGADTKYADQKIGLLPKWAVDEGRGDTHDFQPVNNNPFSPKQRADGGAVDDDPQQLGILGTSLQGPMALTAAMGEHADWDKFERTARPSTNIEDDRNRPKTFKEKYNEFIDNATEDITSPLFRADGGALGQAVDEAVTPTSPGSSVDPGVFQPKTSGPSLPNAEYWEQKYPNVTQRNVNVSIPIGQNIEAVAKGSAFNTSESRFSNPQGMAGVRLKFAHGGRVAARNVNHSPTEAQKLANNYAHDKVHMAGLRISIETAKGHYRRGTDKDGKEWRVKMPESYGYILGTTARDKDHVDCFVGPHSKAPHIFVIDQINHETGKYDEAKCFIGFSSEKHALRTYHQAFSDGHGKDRVGKITGMSVQEFRDWLNHGDTHKPFTHVASRKERVQDILKRHSIETGA
jgi:hypothetical protein